MKYTSHFASSGERSDTVGLLSRHSRSLATQQDQNSSCLRILTASYLRRKNVPERCTSYVKTSRPFPESSSRGPFLVTRFFFFSDDYFTQVLEW